MIIIVRFLIIPLILLLYFFLGRAFIYAFGKIITSNPFETIILVFVLFLFLLRISILFFRLKRNPETKELYGSFEILLGFYIFLLTLIQFVNPSIDGNLTYRCWMVLIGGVYGPIYVIVRGLESVVAGRYDKFIKINNTKPNNEQYMGKIFGIKLYKRKWDEKIFIYIARIIDK